MCTVSFIPEGEKIFLTSNRDEKFYRSDAVPPELYKMSTGNILFPKDKDAGGTWAALHEAGHSIIFLNGGFIRHVPQPPYRKSRGQVLLDLVDSFSPEITFRTITLENIEPFTAVIFEKDQLLECRWDGARKTITPKDVTQAHIWSSVTLYEPDVIERRNQWFRNWLEQQKEFRPSLNAILDFHQFTGDGDSHNDLRMNRNGVVYTVSITGIEISQDSGHMHYLDLKNHLQHTQSIHFDKTICVP